MPDDRARALLLARANHQTPRRDVRRFVALRLLLVVPLLVATLVLHLSGTDLVILKIGRIILLAALFGGLAYLRRRKQPDQPTESGDAPQGIRRRGKRKLRSAEGRAPPSSPT